SYSCNVTPEAMTFANGGGLATTKPRAPTSRRGLLRGGCGQRTWMCAVAASGRTPEAAAHTHPAATRTRPKPTKQGPASHATHPPEAHKQGPMPETQNAPCGAPCVTGGEGGIRTPEAL